MKNLYPRVGMLCLFLMAVSFYKPLHASTNDDFAFVLQCPDDVTVSCDAELWDLSIYGQAYHKVGSTWCPAGDPVVTYNLGMCNTGTITRTWSVEDPNWNWESCTQTIYVQGANGGFNESNIHWPDDITLEGCNPNTSPNALPYGAQKPTWDYVACSMIARSYSDELYVVNAMCKKIIRTWTVVDCCQEGHDSYGNATGTWTHMQKIEIINDEVPNVTCPEDIHVTSTNCSDAVVQVPSIQVDPTSCGGDFTITNNSPYATYGGANISGTYPVGTTKVKYLIKYGCGQYTTCTVNVVVGNDSKPTPYCIGSITVALMGIDSDKDGVNDQGMVAIWAKDFDNGSTAGCNSGPVNFSFSPDSLVMNRTFTCEHVGTNLVKVWVIDSNGNKDFCEVNLVVQNNSANIKDCEPEQTDDTDDPTPDTPKNYTVGGQVKSAYHTALQGVNLTMYSGLSDTTYTYTHDTTITYDLDTIQVDTGNQVIVHIDTIVATTIDTLISEGKWSTYSDSLGKYTFDTIAVDSSVYTVTATLNEAHQELADASHLKEVNSGDLQLIMDVILDKATFSTRKQRIAADINQDGILDFEDLMLMYKYLTKKSDRLTENNWVIVADTYLTSDLAPTHGYNSVPVHILAADRLDVGFTLVQLGKVTEQESRTQAYKVDLTETEEPASTGIRTNPYKANQLRIYAYPNPFHDKVYLAYDRATIGDNIAVQLLDVSGRLLYTTSQKADATKGIIEINEDFEYRGVIIYRMVYNNQTLVGKLIKE